MVSKEITIDGDDIPTLLLICRYMRRHRNSCFTPKEVDEIYELTKKILELE